MARLSEAPDTEVVTGGDSTAAEAVDPRAVRASLAVATGADIAPMRIAPAAPAQDAGDGVFAQRQVVLDGRPSSVAIRSLGSGRWALDEDGRRSHVVIGADTLGENGRRVREVLVDGFRFVVETEPERIASLRERASQGRAAGAHGGPLQVKAIIPGKVVAVSVAPGDAVTAGQQLLVVEAMKMQNELRAPRDGTIERIAVAVGGKIEIGDLLVVIG